MPNEDPSISFLLKDREVTLLPLHHRECFRKKIWVKAFLIISLQYITFFNLLIFAKFAPINFNLPSFFYLAISFSCILNCIIRSSDYQKVPFWTITEHYWGWRKSNGNLHCLTKWTHEIFCWVCRWMYMRYWLCLDAPWLHQIASLHMSQIIRNPLLRILISVINAS